MKKRKSKAANRLSWNLLYYNIYYNQSKQKVTDAQRISPIQKNLNRLQSNGTDCFFTCFIMTISIEAEKMQLRLHLQAKAYIRIRLIFRYFLTVHVVNHDSDQDV